MKFIIVVVATAVAVILSTSQAGARAQDPAPAAPASPTAEPYGDPPVGVNSFATTRAFAASRDVVWRRTIRYLAANGVSPDTIDREAGTLMASGVTSQGHWVSCPRERGRLNEVSYKVSVLLDVRPDGRTTVTVLMTGEGKQARRRRILVIPVGMSRHTLVCPSTGRMEDGLFAYLAGDGE